MLKRPALILAFSPKGEGKSSGAFFLADERPASSVDRNHGLRKTISLSPFEDVPASLWSRPWLSSLT